MASDQRKQELLEETFNTITEAFTKFGLHRRSPKLFVIYVHDTGTQTDTHEKTSKDYIQWFKNIQYNVASDQSSHGFGPTNAQGPPGAGRDVITDQICLLPTSANAENVDYVVVFYSKDLARYTKEEREFRKDNKTYSEAIFDACEKLELPLKDSQSAISEIYQVYDSYRQQGQQSTPKFKLHHASTEMALLRHRNKQSKFKGTIQIIPCSNNEYRSWDKDLEWDANFMNTQSSNVRIHVEPTQRYRKFFDVLLQLDPNEEDKHFITVMQKCFKKCSKSLESGMDEDRYRIEYMANISQGWRELSSQWEKLDRPLTPERIRDDLKLFSKIDCASLGRVTGGNLPQDICDIELALSKGGVMAPISSSNEVNHGVKEREVVQSKSLFDERIFGKETRRPRTIFIEGAPGAGKTTMCRRMMGNDAFWENFDIVLRIPMQKLDQARQQGISLGQVLLNEYFSGSLRGRDLSEKLQEMILNDVTHNTRDDDPSLKRHILILLDGLDESQHWQRDPRLLAKLMSHSATIITSRFYNPSSLPISIDLQLEALGLSFSSVETYLRNPDFIEPALGNDICRYIQADAHVADMIRIPINLDIFCSSWGERQEQTTITNQPTGYDSLNGEPASPNLSSLYNAVVRSQWRKSIPLLGKIDPVSLEPVDAATVDAIRDFARLQSLVHLETSFLAFMAHKMMMSGAIEFTDSEVVDFVQLYEQGQLRIPLSFERNIARLPFLRSNRRGHRRVYCFVHLTFQEYFAARKLSESPEWQKDFRKHKYTRQFAVTWRFFVGFRSTVKDLDEFFDLLESEPRDLVGKHHIQLLMGCLWECRNGVKPSRSSEYQKRIEDWFRLESIIPYCYFYISNYIEFPEHIVWKIFDEIMESVSNEPQNAYQIQGLQRKSMSYEFIQHITKKQKENELMVMPEGPQVALPQEFCESIEDILFAEWILEPQERLPRTIVSSLLEQIASWGHDVDGILRSNSASRVLQNQRYLPKEMIPQLLDLARSENPAQQQAANEILISQDTIPREAIDQEIEKFAEGNSINEGWLLERKDLHPEAIAKVLEWLKKCVLAGTDSLRMDAIQILENQHLRSDIIDNLGQTLLLQGPDARGHQKFALRVLSLVRGLSTNMLKKIAPFVGDNDPDLSHDARIILEGEHSRDQLPSVVLEELRSLFEDGDDSVKLLTSQFLYADGANTDRIIQWLIPKTKDRFLSACDHFTAVRILSRISQLPEDFIECLEEQIINKWEGKKDENLDWETALAILSSQSDLSEEFLINLAMNAPKLELQKSYGPWTDAQTLFCNQERLEERVVKILIEKFPYCNGDMPFRIFKLSVCGDPLTTKFTSEIHSDTVSGCLVTAMRVHGQFGPESIERLSSLLTTKPTSKLSKLKSVQAASVLCKQNKLRGEVLSTLHDIFQASWSEVSEKYQDLWEHRDAEQFWDNLERFDSHSIYHILYSKFLREHADELSPAYIDGRNLYFYTSAGDLVQKELADEKTFRERFRLAQKDAEIPEWARIKKSTTLSA